ncbi:MAG: response regulator transcription factor [Bacteroidales bacterium]|jgi:DNA-binding NarL/FixJ family response regulator|nr:response regulator transcription factor [Bacteroidales bacterium]
MVFIIADNQELTRFAVERMLDTYADKQVFHASNKANLVSLLRVHEQSVVIMDYALFDFPDIQNLVILAQRYPMSQWVLLSDDLAEQHMSNIVYNTTNVGILFKDSPLADITTAINMAHEGQRFISQHVMEVLLAQRKQEEDKSQLTRTEIEIIRAITQGKTTKEIASERSSSIHTINTHRKNIFRKLGVNTAHEAVKAVVRAGLIDESEYYI